MLGLPEVVRTQQVVLKKINQFSGHVLLTFCEHHQLLDHLSHFYTTGSLNGRFVFDVPPRRQKTWCRSSQLEQTALHLGHNSFWMFRMKLPDWDHWPLTAAILLGAKPVSNSHTFMSQNNFILPH